MNRKFSLVKDVKREERRRWWGKHLRPPHSTVPCFNYWLSRIKSRSLLLFLTKISLARSTYNFNVWVKGIFCIFFFAQQFYRKLWWSAIYGGNLVIHSIYAGPNQPHHVWALRYYFTDTLKRSASLIDNKI